MGQCILCPKQLSFYLPTPWRGLGLAVPVVTECADRYIEREHYVVKVTALWTVLFLIPAVLRAFGQALVLCLTVVL